MYNKNSAKNKKLIAVIDVQRNLDKLFPVIYLTLKLLSQCKHDLFINK